MKQLPNIVRQRLQATRPDAHPDADVLAAFAEKGLSKRERGAVLEHLSRCGDCRDILSFALPSPQIESERAARIAGSAIWARWPVLRWGALGACVVVVGAAVTLEFRTLESHTLNRVSQNAAVENAPAPVSAYVKSANQNAAKDVPASPAPQKPARAKRDQAVMSSQNESVVASLAKAKPSAPSGRAKANSDPAAESQLSARVPAAANQPARQSASEAVEVAANPEVPTSSPVDSEAKIATLDERADAPGKAKEAGVGGPASAPKTMALAKNETAASTVSPAATKIVPRWTLSSDGILQRSLDSGKTWTTVEVNNTATLRALAAIGTEIWVGGSGGALFHSADAGQHWQKVTPMVHDQVLAADIIGVEFTDRQHGKLTTANQQVWTTSDAGATWTTK